MVMRGVGVDLAHTQPRSLGDCGDGKSGGPTPKAQRASPRPKDRVSAQRLVGYSRRVTFLSHRSSVLLLFPHTYVSPSMPLPAFHLYQDGR